MPSINKLLSGYEQAWRTLNKLPHYKYIAKPAYRLFGGNRYPLVSVPLTFSLMDFLFHRVLHQLMEDFKNNQTPMANFEFHLWSHLLWVSLGVPLALHKYYNMPSAPVQMRPSKLITSFCSMFKTCKSESKNKKIQENQPLSEVKISR